MSIIFKIESSVAFISLNRPDPLNSFNKQMALELQDALDECAKNSNVRAIFLTGEGRAFSAGQYLSEAMAPGVKIADMVRIIYNPIIKKIRNIEKPVVCSVNGVAAGAGANIAIACDITIAAESATFIQSFGKIGLIPDSAGTFFLPRLVGMQRATAMMMLSEKITAQQALDFGMIYKVFPDDKIKEEGLNLAKQLAMLPTAGLGLTKRALNKSFNNNLDEQLALEEELQDAAGNTYDFKEGVKAFLEKRKPVFKGC